MFASLVPAALAFCISAVGGICAGEKFLGLGVLLIASPRAWCTVKRVCCAGAAFPTRSFSVHRIGYVEGLSPLYCYSFRISNENRVYRSTRKNIDANSIFDTSKPSLSVSKEHTGMPMDAEQPHSIVRYVEASDAMSNTTCYSNYKLVHTVATPPLRFSRGVARSRPYPREPAQEPQLRDGRTGDVGAWQDGARRPGRYDG